MPKIIGNTKGITLNQDGQFQVDNKFEGPAYVVQDMGLGIEEKVISITREGDLLKPEYTSERAYLHKGFEFLIECSDCKAITKVEKYGLSETKP